MDISEPKGKTMTKEDNRVLRLSRYHAKSVIQSISAKRRGRVEFDELVSIGYIAGMPHKDKQSLWRWIRNAQIDFVVEKFSNESFKFNVRKDVVKDQTEMTGDMIDLYDALKNADLSATETGVLMQRFWKGMTFVAIAEKMRVTHQTVEERYYKPAIIKLGLFLKER